MELPSIDIPGYDYAGSTYSTIPDIGDLMAYEAPVFEDLLAEASSSLLGAVATDGLSLLLPAVAGVAAWLTSGDTTRQKIEFDDKGVVGMPKNAKKGLAKPKSQPKKQVSGHHNNSVVMSTVPAAKGVVSKTSQPSIKHTREGVLVKHREYLGDITSTGTGFAVIGGALVAPSNPACFPWLSSIADRYEQYRFKKLTLEYLSEASTATSGVVMIAFDRNPNRTSPGYKASILEIQDCIRTPPWQSVALNVPLDGQIRYNGSVANLSTTSTTTANTGVNNTDLRLTATGQLYTAVSGVASGTVGEAYLTYEVEFMRPTLSTPTYCWADTQFTASTASIPLTGGSRTFGNVLASTPDGAYQWNINIAGPVFIYLAGPTTAAAGGLTMTSNVGTLTACYSAIATLTFAGAWTLTGISGIKTVTLQINSLTNLNVSSTNPLVLRILPYDRSLTSFTI